ncbi:Uncharacterised protein [Bordetella pertussis]|nr:Uncharacterised protein [Bordetella pertussis]
MAGSRSSSRRPRRRTARRASTASAICVHRMPICARTKAW